jgi:DAACS family dicarboxylate/amino acid:cation (Na+ or H+) symporter
LVSSTSSQQTSSTNTTPAATSSTTSAPSPTSSSPQTPAGGSAPPKSSVEDQPTLDPLKNFASYVPENVVDPFRKNNVISIVFLAILLGTALRATKSDVVANGVASLFSAFAKLLAWIVEIVPFAVLGVVAAVVGKSGASVFAQLGLFLVTVIAGLLLQAVAYYSLLLFFVARRSPIQFFAGALDSITTALSCGSSLATLPVTLRVLNDNLKVSTSSARLAACVGTNLNHDGIILYEAAAAMFVARGFGYEVGPAQVVTIALSSVMAGIGIAGVPEAGLITLPLVLTAAGLPPEVVGVVVPLILPVDWLIGRFRAATNVTSDMTVATILDRLAPDSPGSDHSP